MPAHQAGSPRISSTVTKHNPRPRKYATASERQAAYRARAPEVCFRAEAKTVETLDNIADTIDQSRADVLLSMTKFALANHDWARFGLTHRPLPYGYGVQPATNPAPIWKRKRPKSLGKPVPLTPKQKAAAKAMAKAAGRKYPNLVDNIAASRLENPTVKKPTPAQLAARARFAEMARSGAFKRKATKRKANPQAGDAYIVEDSGFNGEWEWPGFAFESMKRLKGFEKYSKLNMPMLFSTREEAQKWLPIIYDLNIGTKQRIRKVGKREMESIKKFELDDRSKNPARRKKTVSEKISQLVHEGYPQKQAVAVALSEQRAGKVKRNPTDMTVAQTILAQLGGGRFMAMTGAKNFVGGSQFLGFTIPRNMSKANRVTITYSPGRDLYDMTFLKVARGGLDSSEVAKFEGVYADQLRSLFTQVTGMETSLGTLGRKPNPATGAKKSRTKLNPMAAPVQVSSDSMFKYAVEAKRSLGSAGAVFETVAAFHTKTQAQDYAKAILASHPAATLRIKTYSRQK